MARSGAAKVKQGSKNSTMMNNLLNYENSEAMKLMNMVQNRANNEKLGESMKDEEYSEMMNQK